MFDGKTLYCVYNGNKNIKCVHIYTLDLKSFRLWLGGVELQGQWQWIGSGRALTYAGWYSGEPNNSGGLEECMEYYCEGDHYNGWNDQDCSNEMAFLCEFEMPY